MFFTHHKERDMRKIVCLLLILGMAVPLIFARGGSVRDNSDRFIAGVTEFEPMNFRDARGNWTGFDTELPNSSAKDWVCGLSFNLSRGRKSSPN